MDGAHEYWSEIELFDEFGVFAKFSHGIFLELFLFDEIVLESGGGAKDRLVIDASFPHDGVSHFSVGTLDEVFDVKKRKSLGMFAQLFDWIVTARNDPAAVHLEDDKLRIGALEELVEEDDPVFGCEFDSVVVIAEGHSGGFYFFSDGVELVGHVAPVIEI